MRRGKGRGLDVCSQVRGGGGQRPLRSPHGEGGCGRGGG
jgi:hypothetical protein